MSIEDVYYSDLHAVSHSMAWHLIYMMYLSEGEAGPSRLLACSVRGQTRPCDDTAARLPGGQSDVFSTELWVS